MGWQDFAVWGIGIVVAAVVLRRMWCFFRGRRRGGCASCASTHCALRRHAAGAAAATADHSPKNTGLKRPLAGKGCEPDGSSLSRHFSTGMPGYLPEKKRFPAATPRRMAPVHGQRQGRHLPQARSGMRLRSRRRHAAHKIAGGRNNFRRETLSLPRNQAHTQCPDFFTSFFSG